MARIPQVEQRVETQALPGYRQQGVDVSSDMAAVGRGIEQAGRRMERVGGVAMDYYKQKEIDAAHDAWTAASQEAEDAVFELRSKEGDAINGFKDAPGPAGPDGVATTIPGMVVEAEKRLKDVYSKSTKGLSGSAREKFDRQWSGFAASRMRVIRGHYDDQRRKLTVANADANITKSISTAGAYASDAGIVEEQKFQIASEVGLKARALNWSPEITAGELRARHSALTSAVVEKRLQQDLPVKAGEFLTAAEKAGEIDGRVATDLRGKIETVGAAVRATEVANQAATAFPDDEIAAKNAARKALADSPRALAMAINDIQARASDRRQAKSDQKISKVSALQSMIVPGPGVTSAGALSVIQKETDGEMRAIGWRLYREFYGASGSGSGSGSGAGGSADAGEGAWPKPSLLSRMDVDAFKREVDGGRVSISEPVEISAETVSQSAESAQAAAARVTEAAANGSQMFIEDKSGMRAVSLRGSTLLDSKGQVVQLTALGDAKLVIKDAQQAVHSLSPDAFAGILGRRALLGRWSEAEYKEAQKYMDDVRVKGRLSDSQIKSMVGDKLNISGESTAFDELVGDNPGILDVLRDRLKDMPKEKLDALSVQKELTDVLMQKGEAKDGTDMRLYEALKSGKADNWTPFLDNEQEAETAAAFNQVADTAGRSGGKIDDQKKVLGRYWLMNRLGAAKTPGFQRALADIPTSLNGRALSQMEREQRALAKLVYGDPTMEFTRSRTSKP